MIIRMEILALWSVLLNDFLLALPYRVLKYGSIEFSMNRNNIDIPFSMNRNNMDIPLDFYVSIIESSTYLMILDSY